MRSTLLVLILSLIITSIAGAQFRKSDVELTFSGSFGAWETSSTSTGGSGTSSYSYTSSDSRNFLWLSIMPGYYIADGFSLEPELSVLAIEKSPPSFFFLGNISYTYSIPESKVAPFGRVGYGVSNGVTYPMFGNTPLKISKDLNIGVFNAGGGVKILLNSSIALRVEVNYRRFAWKDEYNYSFGSSKNDNKQSTTAFNFGFSVLL